MRVPIGVPRGGVWGRVQGSGGGCFPEKTREKGNGVGSGGTGKGTGTSMRKLCQNYLLANYPLVSPRSIRFKIITRMKSLFSNYLGDYSYSFRGSVE